MNTAEQRIFVCEKLLGFEKADVSHGHFWYWPRGFKTCSSRPYVEFMELPQLTLDWLHECWLKLMPEQKLNFIRHLLALVLTDEYVPVYSTMIALEDATAEQRLAALVETLKQSQPVLPAKQS